MSSRSRKDVKTPMAVLSKLSPAKFFRKNREMMSQASTSQRPTRLRRLNFGKNSFGESTGVYSSGSTKTSRASSKGRSSPAVLSPNQIMIRRLYDRINRAHKASQRQNTNQLWQENRNSLDSTLKEHDKKQKSLASSRFLLYHHPEYEPHPETVSADNILEATMNAASFRASTVDQVKVLVVPESADYAGASGKEVKRYQKLPVTTIGNVSQIPPVLDWTAIPNNMHEDDGKFLTNIPFLGDEFIDKDAKFIDEMVTLYEGKVHEANDSSSSYSKMDDEVLYTLIQAMIKIEAESGRSVFKDEDEVDSTTVPAIKEPEGDLHSKSEELTELTDESRKNENADEGQESPNSTSKETTFSDVAAKLLLHTGESKSEDASPSTAMPHSSSGSPDTPLEENVKNLEELMSADVEVEPIDLTRNIEEIVMSEADKTDEVTTALLTLPVPTLETEDSGEVCLEECKIPSEESHFEDEKVISTVDEASCLGDRDTQAVIAISNTDNQPGSSDSSNGSAWSDGKPSEAIYTLLSYTFRGLGTIKEIKDRYESIEKTKSTPPLRILPNGMEQQNPSSYSIPNIEGPFAKYLPKEMTMHAYQVLFCRRCYTYDCKRHTGDDQVDVKHYNKSRQKPATSTSSTPSLNSSGSSQNAFNFLCTNPDCWKMNDVTAQAPDQILAEWSPSDRSLFSCFIDSFPSNYCFIAYLMRNKSCAQVKEYADLEQVPSKMESGSRAATSRRMAKSKHRKNRLGFYKKFSSHSNNKKNVTRRWINNVKKTEKSRESEGGIKSAGGKLPARYMPCLHEKGEACDSSCTCRINNTSCEKFCTCAMTCEPCSSRFPGCKCQSTCDSKRCICFAAARECDPDLCLGCGANEHALEKISCHNVNIQRKLHKHLLMGRSDISGWGIYIKNDAQKGEFIAEYRGELISHDESERRGHVYDKIQHTFLFELNDHFVVDATRKGNKARFVNSSKNPNCEVKRMLVNGDHRIGIYAKRFIEAGEELFYDYEDVLEKQQKAAEAGGGGAPSRRTQE